MSCQGSASSLAVVLVWRGRCYAIPYRLLLHSWAWHALNESCALLRSFWCPQQGYWCTRYKVKNLTGWQLQELFGRRPDVSCRSCLKQDEVETSQHFRICEFKSKNPGSNAFRYPADLTGRDIKHPSRFVVSSVDTKNLINGDFCLE